MTSTQPWPASKVQQTLDLPSGTQQYRLEFSFPFCVFRVVYEELALATPTDFSVPVYYDLM